MKSDSKKAQDQQSRRDVMRTGAVAAAGVTAALNVPYTAWAQGSDTIKVGLIGCGGRGTGAATQALNADKGTKLTAMGDAFEHRLEGSLKQITRQMGDRVKDKIALKDDHKFIGLDSYKHVIDSGVDAVVLTTPPGYRPDSLRYAIEKGKHVFCEKPVAADAPGVRSVLESSELAKKKGLALVSGLCWRYHNPKRETFKRVQDGAVGDIIATRSTYLTGTLWHRGREPEWTDMHYQVANWLYYTWLSGDHIAEQAIHSIDKNQWALGDPTPVACMGVGGRQVRTDPKFGHIYDHFGLEFEFANGVRSYHFCRQTGGCYNSTDDIVMGTKGIAHTSKHQIEGENKWRYRGDANDMYQTEHDELFKSIRDGEVLNNGHYMSISTMMAIMGRMVAYTGKRVTWDEAFNSKEVLGPKDKYSWGPAEEPPVAMPGQTKLV